MKTVLSGIRATGRLHIGNYFGAVSGMIDLQNNPTYQTLYMVADVHALTTPYTVSELEVNRRQVVIDYLAAGLDPEKSIIFIQSMVPSHTELSFYLSSVVSVARLQHLPTFKEKVKQYPEHATMALLNYPCLMAADILLYKAEAVPVGIDQEPHIEIARYIARSMNDTYGCDFPEPQRFETLGSYVPSLTGHGKMSKSVPGTYINLTDDASTVEKRIKSIPTDIGKGSIKKLDNYKSAFHQTSYLADGATNESEGVAALMILVELFQGKEQRAAYEQAYRSTGIRYGEVKHDLSQAITVHLAPFQERRKELEHNTNYVDQVIETGAEQATQIAKQTITEVRKRLGLG